MTTYVDQVWPNRLMSLVPRGSHAVTGPDPLYPEMGVLARSGAPARSEAPTPCRWRSTCA